MMKILLNIFLGCCFMFSNSIVAQSDYEDVNKYWNYRSRFLGDNGFGGFVSIGDGPGESIPASSRDINCNCMTDWGLVHSGAERHNGSGILKWGDATVHLGYYLSLLAMEYQNLKYAKADTKETVKELYFALKAYERLDRMAEVKLGMEPALNGFFLRDDVPVDFYTRKGQPESRRFRHKERGAYDCVSSDFCKKASGVDNGRYTSQDQVTALLMGFAFVKKFAGELSYPPHSDEKFGDLAMLYTHLMVAYMKEKKWKIRSPDGQKISNRWGGDARAFNVLFASAASAITEGKFDYDYHKKVWIGRIIKGSYAWAFGLHSERNYSLIFRLMMISDQWSANKMAKRAKKSGKIFYALADAVLNGREVGAAITKDDFQALVKSAPWNGPCFGTEGCEAPDGWKSSQLWFHTNHKNGNPHGQKYEYPGIDFMFLYNLYHYYYRAELPVYKTPKPKKKAESKRKTAPLNAPKFDHGKGKKNKKSNE